MDIKTPDWLNRTLARAGLDAQAPHEDTPRILVVDDEPVNLHVVTETLRPLGCTILVATDGEQALRIVERTHPALVLLDVMMPAIDGFEVCRRMKADPELASIPVIFCSALGYAAARVHGLESGAVDFITKPFDPSEVLARVSTQLAISRLVHGLQDRNQELERELAFARELREQELRRMQEVLVGTSEPVRELRAAIDAHARTQEPLLLLADPGVGEEAVARAIHEASPRRDRPFLRIECPQLRPADVRGIFHARHDGALGRLELARGGTVFFDGLHRMPAELQGPLFSLVAALDRACVAGEPSALDVRLIASATSTPLGADPFEVQALWRDRAVSRKTLRLPTLAERRADIPALVAFYAERHAKLLGRTIDTVSDETLEALCRHWWPGNLRELEEVVRSGVLRSTGATLEIDARMLADGIPFGSYRLLRKLSEGGMGTLWEASHQLLVRPAVVKLIRAQEPSKRDELQRRFEVEAQVTAKLRSPNTVTLFDYGITDDGDFFYVMEKLDGIDLEDAVDRFGPMPPTRATHLLMQACRSLAEAHANGLVHRDVKPANLFLSRQGLDVDVLKVLDFGVVKLPRAPGSGASQDGAQYGSPAYMSPEAITGELELDGRADVYSLGCVAYWMLTGQLPFDANTATAILMQHLTATPTPPSERAPGAVPRALEALVLRCLAKDRDARPSALELYEALAATGLAAAWSSVAAVAWWDDLLPDVMRRG